MKYGVASIWLIEDGMFLGLRQLLSKCYMNRYLLLDAM